MIPVISRRKFTQSLVAGTAALAVEQTNSLFSSRSFALGSDSKGTDVRLRNVSTETRFYPFRTPLKFGGMIHNDLTVLEVTVEVESRTGRRSRGRGVMSIGNIWGWPSRVVSSDKTLAAMIAVGKRIADRAASFDEFGHPLELCSSLGRFYNEIAENVVAEMKLPESMPRLAQLVVASPLEAALFDAYGKSQNTNVFNLLGKEYVNTDLSRYLNADFENEYLDRYTSRAPKKVMPLYHLVGGLDPLTNADVTKPVNDGIPLTLEQWILADGLTHFKIKLNGNDLEKDIDRVVRIEQTVSATQKKRNVQKWWYSADFNEKCPNEDYVLKWLEEVRRQAPNAFRSLQYIEQPTARDLLSLPRITMFRGAKVKPVVIDESLVDFETFQRALKMGYSGVALKACKGLAESLLMGAAAQKYRCFLCVQDLTCPGESFLQSVSLAARIPGVAAIEGNARQFCPAANAPYQLRFPGIFNIKDGAVQTGVLDGPGLGF